MNVTLYTKPNCSACSQAKALLRNSGNSFNELRLNEDFTKEHLLSMYPTAKTYPVVVIDNYYVGGFTELKEEVQNSNSTKLLME